jgi:hypothetical protein
LAIELMIDIVNIVVNINYLAIELIDIVNVIFNSSDVVVNVVNIVNVILNTVMNIIVK